MNANEGIFQPVSNPTPSSSPFAAVGGGPSSPFAAVGDSPFAAVSDVANGSRVVEPGKPAKLPEKRAKEPESPFQIVESQEFGFEAQKPLQAVPFEAAQATTPFALAPQQAVAQAPARAPESQAYQVPPAFGNWGQPALQAAIEPQFVPQPTPAFAPQPPAPAPAAPAPAYAMPQQAPAHDSAAIRQLELRAIFGVDREMGAEEIMQRVRALPGIRHVARVGAQEAQAVENLKHVLSNLGLGSGNLKIYTGSIPVDFIREGEVMLVVQTDGGFAPGVRETLMIVARELAKL